MGQREKNRKAKRAEQQRAQMKPTPVDIVFSLIPPILLFGLRSFAGPCRHEDGSAATCTMAGTVLAIFALVAVALVVMRLLGADSKTRRAFDFLLVIAGILIAVSPGTVLPLCMMTTMHCQSVMAPFARTMGVALILGALACEFTVDREVPTGRKRRR